MIDINKLRRLVQAATPGPDGVSLNWVKLLQDFQKEANPATVSELLDRLEAAESDAFEQARLNGMGASREAALMAKLEAAEKSDAESIAMYRKSRDERDALRAEVSDLTINVAFLDNLKKSYEELIEELQDERDRLRAKVEEMENERTIDEQRIADLMAELTRVGQENEELRTKIDEMEQQKPVGKFIQHPSNGLWEQDGYGDNPDSRPLYTLPVAQPTPSMPDGWLAGCLCLTFDLVDLQLSDGSVLCGCVPQANGDYWWEGPSGEVFIDPKYANVTHWRLAAEP